MHPSPVPTLQDGGAKQTPVQSAAIKQSGVAGLSTHTVPSGHGACSSDDPAQVGAQIPGQSKPSRAIHAVFGSIVHENSSQHPSPVFVLHLGGDKQTPVQSAAIKQSGVAGLFTQNVPGEQGS